MPLSLELMLVKIVELLSTDAHMFQAPIVLLLQLQTSQRLAVLSIIMPDALDPLMVAYIANGLQQQQDKVHAKI